MVIPIHIPFPQINFNIHFSCMRFILSGFIFSPTLTLGFVFYVSRPPFCLFAVCLFVGFSLFIYNWNLKAVVNADDAAFCCCCRRCFPDYFYSYIYVAYLDYIYECSYIYFLDLFWSWSSSLFVCLFVLLIWCPVTLTLSLSVSFPHLKLFPLSFPRFPFPFPFPSRYFPLFIVMWFKWPRFTYCNLIWVEEGCVC